MRTCYGICSETRSEIHPGGKIVSHNHNSSLNYRISAPVDKWGSCFTCEVTPHSHKVGMRYSVLVSSSFMNNWQGQSSANQYPGDDLHVDYITIPGATINDLNHAFF